MKHSLLYIYLLAAVLFGAVMFWAGLIGNNSNSLKYKINDNEIDSSIECVFPAQDSPMQGYYIDGELSEYYFFDSLGFELLKIITLDDVKRYEFVSSGDDIDLYDRLYPIVEFIHDPDRSVHLMLLDYDDRELVRLIIEDGVVTWRL